MLHDAERGKTHRELEGVPAADRVAQPEYWLAVELKRDRERGGAEVTALPRPLAAAMRLAAHQCWSLAHEGSRSEAPRGSHAAAGEPGKL